MSKGENDHSFTRTNQSQHGSITRQGANGYVLSMGTQIWDPERIPEWGPERTPERGPEMEKLTFGTGLSFIHFLSVWDPETARKWQSVQRKELIFSTF